jgi:glutathione S-transferase
MEFQQTALNRPMSGVFQALIRTAPDQRDPAAIAAATAESAVIWAIIDQRLGSMPYLAGDTLTLADIPFGVHVHRWLNMDLPTRPAAPNLSAWYQRLLGRPAYKAHCAGVIS